MKIFNDPIHGYMEMDALSVSIIDTPQFQRLRDLKQLGILYYVFPGASHNRFEHSLGVGHLASAMVTSFQRKQPELEISSQDITNLRIAGLVHDLGHGPFSHVFEHGFMSLVNPTTEYDHEGMSLKMFDYLLEDNNIDLEKNDIRFIKELVVGAKKRKGLLRSDGRDFLYEVVANGKNCIDVDKFDYLARDTQNLFGPNAGRFDFSRIFGFNRVIDNEIAYHHSTSFDLYNLFQQRYTLHRQIYTHRKGKAVEYMICDAMVLANNELKISKSTETPEAFMLMTDCIVKTIECSTTVSLQPARDIIRRIRKRSLYAFVDEYLVPSALADKIPNVTSLDISTHNVTSLNLRPEDIIVHDGKVNYNLQDQNPIDKVSFYSSSDMTKTFKMPKEQISLMFPEKFEERILRVYSRSLNPEIQQAIMSAFRQFLRVYCPKLPPPSPITKVSPLDDLRLNNTANTAVSKQLFQSSMDPIPENPSKRSRIE